jgi:hypothetical protein
MKDLLLFLHVPKTAGTSLVTAMRTLLPSNETLIIYGAGRTSQMIMQDVESLTAAQRGDIRFIAGHQVWYGIHDLFPGRTPRYLTFLREPVARVISDYYKILRTPANQYHAQMIRDNTSLEEFLRGGVSPLVMNHMTVLLGRDRVTPGHNGEQCSLTDQTLLERAVENLRTFWFVGLTESYVADLARIRELTGLQIDELTLNQRPTHQGEDLAPSLIEIAARANRMDAQLYELAVRIHDAQAPGELFGAAG